MVAVIAGQVILLVSLPAVSWEAESSLTEVEAMALVLVAWLEALRVDCWENSPEVTLSLEAMDRVAMAPAAWEESSEAY